MEHDEEIKIAIAIQNIMETPGYAAVKKILNLSIKEANADVRDENRAVNHGAVARAAGALAAMEDFRDCLERMETLEPESDDPKEPQ